MSSQAHLIRRPLRCLVVHSQYASGQVSGENRVVADEVELLRTAGHEVELYNPEVANHSNRLRMAGDALWSRSAVEQVESLVRKMRPDIIHVHNLFPRLSPAVLRATDAVPLVMTLHNFRLQCLPATFFRGTTVCEACLGRVPWRGVAFGCYRGSRSASAVLAASLVLHRAAGSLDRVTRFLAVSDFVREKHIEAGIDAGRIIVKPNFSNAMPRREGAGDCFVVLGRLSPEKGIAELLDVWPPAALEIVGDGPERERLESRATPRVTYAGAIDSERVAGVFMRTRALVQPSRGYEAQGRAVLEAFAAGVPVIASRMGGLPEIIEHGVNGLLVDLDDKRGWQEAVERLMDDAESKRLGEGAYRTWEARFTPEAGLRSLVRGYMTAINTSANSGNA